jgi:hypothetical protein
MRFRVTHLFLLAAVVAVFAISFAKPYPIGNRTIPILSWFIYAAVACRAVASCRDRPAMLAALIVGVSYLAVSVQYGRTSDRWLTSRLLDVIGESMSFEHPPSHNSQVLKFMEIGHHALALVFALGAAAVTGYWSKRENVTKN